MYLLLTKQYLAAIVILLNLGLLGMTLHAYRRNATLSASYFKWLRVAPLVFLLLPSMGLLFLGRGWVADPMHIFYGVLVTGGAAVQLLLSRQTALAQQYRKRPLIHAFLALFVILLTARSWMSG